jgi:hypothetical protein
MYVRNVHIPECGSVFNLAVTKHTCAQNDNVTGSIVTKHLSNKVFKSQNVHIQKMFIVTKRLFKHIHDLT